ncbi:scavenger mRNA decapping enzyme c-term binding domain-containing protein [Phthorimaea operculella]|nr:scavenger mRNA decapping enzyme c-term binding domain-containing protein [Phthorimaea operculella]
MASQDTAVKKTKHWSIGLLDSMKDSANIVKQSERVVVIRDKYPKAKVHYLVLPLEEINSLQKLNKGHVGLLEEFGKLYEELKEEHKDRKLKAGFHAVPSMQRLHMHIISADMVSPCLKTKVHWNSFTTKFFIPYEDLLKELRENGCIKKISNEDHKSLMATLLKCNQCNYMPKNMPNLKEHLLSHDM